MRWSDSITNLMDMSFKQTPGDSEGQRNLVCCSAWGHKELDTTEHTHTHTHTRAITSENLLEMQIFRPYPRPSKPEESGGGAKGQNIRSQYNSSFLQTARKIFNKIQHPFIIKSLSKLGLKRKFLQHYKRWAGTSLVVQWLRLCTPNAGCPGLTHGQESRSHMPQLKGERKIPHTATKTKHPVCHN